MAQEEEQQQRPGYLDGFKLEMVAADGDRDSLLGRLRQWCSYQVNNNRPCFTLMIIVVHVVLSVYRGYQYRQAGSCWIIVARICGLCVQMDLALVLMLTLRRAISSLRVTGASRVLPLDRHIYYHKMVGWIICILAAVHSLAHVAHLAHLANESHVPLIEYLLHDQNVHRRVDGWSAGLANPTGFGCLFIIAIMALFSHRIVRKSGHFEIFYATHVLFVPLYALLALHGRDFWKWIVVPAILFAIEILYRISNIGRGKTCITSATLMSNQVVCLEIERPKDFDFQPGDYIYVNMPSVAKFEWHPFTVSSGPEEQGHLTVHIKAVGGWTSQVRNVFIKNLFNKRTRLLQNWIPCDPSERHSRSLPKKLTFYCPDSLHNSYSSLQITSKSFTHRAYPIEGSVNLQVPVYLNGPYRGVSSQVWDCQHALLIAGGIGVTPFASLLQSLVTRYHNCRTECPNCNHSCISMGATAAITGKLRHMDFLWINRDESSFHWFMPLLLDLRRVQAQSNPMAKLLDIHLYQTRQPKPIQSGISHIKLRSEAEDGVQQIQNLIKYGRPVWDQVFTKIAARSIGAKVSVFYCGPVGLGRDVLAKCKQFGFAFNKEVS